jgi:hypothetical protein
MGKVLALKDSTYSFFWGSDEKGVCVDEDNDE